MNVNVVKNTLNVPGLNYVGLAGTDNEYKNNQLIQFIHQAQAYGLFFVAYLNYCDILTPQISLFGNIYSDDGPPPVPTEIENLQKNAKPFNKRGTPKIHLTYLNSFIPNFSQYVSHFVTSFNEAPYFYWMLTT